MPQYKPQVFKNAHGTWCVIHNCCSNPVRSASTFEEALSLANLHSATYVPFENPITVYIHVTSKWIWKVEICRNLEEVVKVGRDFCLNLEKLFIDSPSLLRPGTKELWFDVDRLPKEYLI